MIKKYLKIVFSMLIIFSSFINAAAFDQSVYEQLDYGLYWAGADNQFEKAGDSTKYGSTYYNRYKPTMIYIHGWQSGSVADQFRETFYDTGSGRPDVDFANLWIAAGYNVGIIYWNQFADESEVKDAEAKIWSVNGSKQMRWLDSNGTHHYGDVNKPVSELLLDNYISAMSKYRGDDIRIVGHSLGNQVAMRLTQLINDSADAGQINANLVPKRVSLLDAFYSNYSKSYLGGQWVGAAVRDIADSLIAKGTAIDSYRTSVATSSIFVGDQNKALQNKLAFVEQSTGYFWSWQQAEKHVAAVWLYLWSIEYPTPYVANSSLSGVSAAASNDLVKQWMSANYRIKQNTGGYSKDLNDDGYKLLNRF